ncbi:hypothetical protein DASC09_018100 [Saccharomycopsis crataegensis]|uniref:Chromatin structure-remodeling complex subunit RSC7 n=1 Tax=Saccharomycopsis crataegensis TaxID=43959 RepID=A0AAV5QJ26_9ASCO|nr:hypothetical protein DASC09_018100 [Saccharomycopsis crataegensis]
MSQETSVSGGNKRTIGEVDSVSESEVVAKSSRLENGESQEVVAADKKDQQNVSKSEEENNEESVSGRKSGDEKDVEVDKNKQTQNVTERAENLPKDELNEEQDKQESELAHKEGGDDDGDDDDDDDNNNKADDSLDIKKEDKSMLDEEFVPDPLDERNESEKNEELDNEPLEDDLDLDVDSSKATSTEPPVASVTSNSKSKVQLKESETGDEYDLEIDEKGEAKIDHEGNLLDGRTFRIPTFMISHKGTRKFMLATKVARTLNLRDSHNLFTKYPQLYKIPLNIKEKFELIDRKMLPVSYKSRAVNLIFTRSVFKVFGSRVILNGKKVDDDYYEQKAIDRGETRGEPAYIDYTHLAQYQDVGGPNINTINNAQQPLSQTVDMASKFQIKSNLTKTLITEENWMLNHCLASKQLDYDCSYDRFKLWNLKMIERDPYTGVKFFPGRTQPSVANWQKIKLIDEEQREVKPNYIKDDPSSGKLTYRAVLDCPNILKSTGLLNVDEGIFGDVVTPEVKEAILRQKRVEKEVLENNYMV